MLYEVITVMRRSPISVSTVLIMQTPVPGLPACAWRGDDGRITSYNVCYTKLLRLAYKYVDPCTTSGTPTSLSGSGTGTTTASISWAAGSPAGSATITYYWNFYTSGGTSVTSGNTTGT